MKQLSEEKERKIQIEFEVNKVRAVEGMKEVDLAIYTPLRIVVVLYGFTRQETDGLMQTLRDQFHYDEKEMIPIRIPKYKLDFLLITDRRTPSREYGYYDDNEEFIDGHELEVATIVVNYVNTISSEGTTDKAVGQIFNDCEVTDAIADLCSRLKEVKIGFTEKNITPCEIVLDKVKISFNMIMGNKPIETM